MLQVARIRALRRMSKAARSASGKAAVLLPAAAERLLRCLRSEAPDPATDEAAWIEIVGLAAEQRVSSVLFHCLRNHAEAVPPGIWRQLSDQSRAVAVRSLAFRRDLANALDALARAEVPAIVLKGGHLALGIYANGATREMNDLDLLVPADRGNDAVSALRDVGYQFIETPTPGHHHHLPRLIKAGAAPIELHTTLSPWPPLSESALAGVWARARPAPSGRHGLALCPEDLVLHLCLHAAYAHTGEFGLRPLCDLREVVRAFPAMNWPLVCSRAAEWRCARGTFLMLYQARHCVGADVPSDTLALFAPPDFDDELATVATTHLFSRKTLSMAVTLQASRPLGFSSAREALAYLRARLLPPWSPHQQIRRRATALALLKRIVSLIVRYRWLPVSVASGGAPQLTALIRRRHRIVRFLEIEAGQWPAPP